MGNAASIIEGAGGFGYPIRFEGRLYRYTNEDLHWHSVSLGAPVCSSPRDCQNMAILLRGHPRPRRARRSPVNPKTIVPGLAKTLVAGGVVSVVACSGATGPGIVVSCPIAAGTILGKLWLSKLG